MRIINRIALLLVIIGAINWGLVGIFQFDLVSEIFGGGYGQTPVPVGARIIFIIVAIAGLWLIPQIWRGWVASRAYETGDLGETGYGRHISNRPV